jgi:hypothetical protein
MFAVKPRVAALVCCTLIGACRDKAPSGPAAPTALCQTAGATIGPVTQPLSVSGLGRIENRFTGEVATLGSTAYTSTWAGIARVAGVPGNAINIWDVSGPAPTLVDSLIVPGNTQTTGDVAVDAEQNLLVVATERAPGRIVIYDNTLPRAPRELSTFTSSDTDPGVHTAEVGRVNGRLYAFLSVIASGVKPSRLVTVDLSDPRAPRQVAAVNIGSPVIHDTHLRDGLLFLALWDLGLEIWDVGGGGMGGSPEVPKVLGRVATAGGEAHNALWFHDAVTGSKRYAFVGQEGPGVVGSSSTGDIHVVDLCDLTNPREVAFYHEDGAGVHNFSADESEGVLYAAYYNGGVRALDVRGDLGACTEAQRDQTGRCDLALMGRLMSSALADESAPFYVWGVEYRAGTVYASDMWHGLWKLNAVRR